MTEVLTSTEFAQEPIQGEKHPLAELTDVSDEDQTDPVDNVETSSSENEGDAHDAVGFGDAMSKILSQNVAEDVQPILAKRTTARMRDIQTDKKEAKSVRLSTAEKREREQKDMVVPDHTMLVQDRKLRTIATKGVVALFNAIEKHQHLNGKQETKHDKQVKNMSKDNFLGLLKASQSKVLEKSVPTSSWAVVQDDFMMSAKLKDWDNEHGTEVGRVRQSGDAEVEAVEDVAWRQTTDDMDSMHEAREASEKPKRRTSVLNPNSKKAKH